MRRSIVVAVAIVLILAADQIDQCRSGTFVWNVLRFDARHHFVELAREMATAAVARGAET